MKLIHSPIRLTAKLLACISLTSTAWAEEHPELALQRANRDQAIAQLEAARAKLQQQEKSIGELTAAIAATRAQITERMANAPTDVAQPDAAAGTKPEVPGSFVADVTHHVVVIDGDQSRGTGFLCISDGHPWVYTAAHVLSGNNQVTVRDHRGKVYREFEYIECAEGLDLVRLKLNNGDAAGLEISTLDESPKAGDVIVAIGNSLGTGSLSAEAGRVTFIDETLWQVDAEIIPGNSGGPVLSLESKKVIGIVTHLVTWRSRGESKLTRETTTKRYAARLDKPIEWRRMPISRFVSEWKYIEKMDQESSIAWASSYLMAARSDSIRPKDNLMHLAEKIITAERDHFHVQRMDGWLKEFRNASNNNRATVIRRGNAILKQIMEDIRLTGKEPKEQDFSWYHREAYQIEREWRERLTSE